MDSMLLGIISFDMTLGMFIGMAASPLMMKGIKVLRQRQRLNRMLREIAETRINSQQVGVSLGHD